MNINNFIWTDSVLLDFKLEDSSQSLTLKIKNYRKDIFLVIFDEINNLTVHDPIYFMKVEEVKIGNRSQIKFWDDDDLVLSFQYGSARIVNQDK